MNHGFWRDVWSRAPTWPDQDPMVLKTMRFEHNVTGRNFDRNRRDALVTERLTKSTWILNGYGFCGNTGVSEYAGGGDISAAIWKKSPLNPDYRIAIDMTTREQLIIGVQAAIGLAELHTFDDKDRPSVAHTDITPGQFVKVNDRFKLNDFNRARFIRVSKNHSLCSFAISKNPGKNRSPEEYTRHALLSEKIDLYSLGNIFYMLLQKQWPFQEENTKEAQRMVKHGYRPSFYEDVWNSTDPYTVALKTAMLRCHQQDPRDRPTASELAYFLKQKLDGLEPGLIASWGEPFASR
uniref:Protein kinase domain-containing protein n=1 Tax=Entomoneis paludosa TaxID=265537 RepID=A0A7S2YMF7_9STRA